jgi:hypothetical protein
LRRIVLIIALVAVVGVAGYFLFRPKSSDGGSKSTSADTSAVKKKSKRKGRLAGKIKPKSKKELREERKRRRKEEKRRKKELKRREREKRRRLKYARKSRGKRRSKRRGRKGQMYVVGAIVSLGDESYAMVDGRRVGVGDVVMGRKIIDIKPDKIIIEAFGKTSTVRVGESVLPISYSGKRRR